MNLTSDIIAAVAKGEDVAAVINGDVPIRITENSGMGYIPRVSLNAYMSAKDLRKTAKLFKKLADNLEERFPLYKG